MSSSISEGIGSEEYGHALPDPQLQANYERRLEKFENMDHGVPGVFDAQEDVFDAVEEVVHEVVSTPKRKRGRPRKATAKQRGNIDSLAGNRSRRKRGYDPDEYFEGSFDGIPPEFHEWVHGLSTREKLQLPEPDHLSEIELSLIFNGINIEDDSPLPPGRYGVDPEFDYAPVMTEEENKGVDEDNSDELMSELHAVYADVEYDDVEEVGYIADYEEEDGLVAKNVLSAKLNPTKEAKPGSELKVQILAARYAAGATSLFDDGDITDHGDDNVVPASSDDDDDEYEEGDDSLGDAYVEELELNK